MIDLVSGVIEKASQDSHTEDDVRHYLAEYHDVGLIEMEVAQPDRLKEILTEMKHCEVVELARSNAWRLPERSENIHIPVRPIERTWFPRPLLHSDESLIHSNESQAGPRGRWNRRHHGFRLAISVLPRFRPMYSCPPVSVEVLQCQSLGSNYAENGMRNDFTHRQS